VLGLSQGDIVRASGLSPASVCRIESGDHRLAYVATLRRAATAYGLTVERFEQLCRGQLTAEDAAKEARVAAA
jgi:transcriptional regulator with XRE-family HTH domain